MQHPLYKTIERIVQAKHSGVFCMIENDHDVKNLEKTHPKLYAMVTSENCDMDMLHKLLSLHYKVNTGSINQDKADEAFGTAAVDKYVKHLVNR